MKLSVLEKLDNAHEDSIWSACWAKEPDLLVTGSVDESVKAWKAVGSDDSTKLQVQHTFTGHTLGVVSVVVNSAGTLAASSSLDSQIRVWDIATSDTKAVFDTPPSETWGVAFSPVSQHLASAGGTTGKVSIWSIGSGEQAAPEVTMSLPPVTDEKLKAKRFVSSVAYSADGSRLACGAMDGTVGIFDVAAGKLLHTVEGHRMPVRTLTFTPDSRMLITGSDDMHANMYDVEKANLIDSLSSHESWVLSVACSPDGQALVTGSSDRKVKLWEVGTRSCVQSLAEHTDQVWGVAFRPDGNRVATVSDDKSIVLYDLS